MPQAAVEQDRVPGPGTLLEGVRERTELSVEAARSLLAKFDLGAEHLARAEAELSPGERSRAGLAVLVARGTNLLLLDEPAAGMNPAETQEITELIGRLRDDGGFTILVIEHDMHVVEGISDRVVALDHGVKIAEGSFEQVASSPAVVEAYLGTGGAERK